MNVIDAVALGVVEGLTEFLPISSTAHLMVAARFLGIGSSDVTKSFEIAIQFGAILAVLALYGRSLARNVDVVKKIAAAFVPTAAVGYLFYYIVKSYLLEHIGVSLAALFFGGIVFILFEIFNPRREAAREGLGEISFLRAIIIGCFQSLAMIPGVSRAGATIIGGLLLGVERKTIVEFSFLLAIPTMAAAAGFDLFKNAETFSAKDFHLLALGGIVSFLVALAGIKFFLRFIQTRTFIPFGMYRIIIAIIFWVVLF